MALLVPTTKEHGDRSHLPSKTEVARRHAAGEAWKPLYEGTETEANVREAIDYLHPLMDALVGRRSYIKPGCSEAWGILAAQYNQINEWSLFGYVPEQS